jgi:uncharacterized protein YecA (UPF0149 family)
MTQTPDIVRLMAPLLEAKFNELDRFPASESEATSDETMMIDVLDGYPTAVVFGPVDIPTETWLPGHRPTAEVMTTPVKRPEPKVGRNGPCPCGSGKKYKKCCGAH